MKPRGPIDRLYTDLYNSPPNLFNSLTKLTKETASIFTMESSKGQVLVSL